MIFRIVAGDIRCRSPQRWRRRRKNKGHEELSPSRPADNSSDTTGSARVATCHNALPASQPIAGVERATDSVRRKRLSDRPGQLLDLASVIDRVTRGLIVSKKFERRRFVVAD